MLARLLTVGLRVHPYISGPALCSRIKDLALLDFDSLSFKFGYTYNNLDL